jgi:hypothetical protein
MADNGLQFFRHDWEHGVHTHLKGRIFRAEGTSYLVLSEPGQDPDWLRVKALNAERTVRDMHSAEVEQHVASQREPAQSER